MQRRRLRDHVDWAALQAAIQTLPRRVAQACFVFAVVAFDVLLVVPMGLIIMFFADRLEGLVGGGWVWWLCLLSCVFVVGAMAAFWHGRVLFALVLVPILCATGTSLLAAVGWAVAFVVGTAFTFEPAVRRRFGLVDDD